MAVTRQMQQASVLASPTDGKATTNGDAHAAPTDIFTRRTLLVLCIPLIILPLGWLSILLTMPAAEEHKIAKAFWLAVRPPHDVLEIRHLHAALAAFALDHPLHVAALIFLSWVTMQTLCVPGTAILALLSGALFGSVWGLVLVSVTCTIGSCSIYLLSNAVGGTIATRLWPKRVAMLRAALRARRGYMLNYVIFMRVTYLLPNTLVNVLLPVIGVPISTFALGTAVGCLPQQFVVVRAGMTLSTLTSLADLMDPRIAVGLFVGGLCFVIPTFLGKKNATEGSGDDKES